MKIEFFHDVICSFCFPMSNRMRKIVAKYPKIEITHRSFALAYEEEQHIQMFGSHLAAKPEVLTHWKEANANDDEKRFNIQGMEETDFLFPTSKPGLVAAKAAGIVGNQAHYWEVFDALQTALFVENRDIADADVIQDVVKNTSIDFDAWKRAVENPETEQAVLGDIALAQQYGLRGVPALVIEGKYVISGAQPQDLIEKTLESIAEEEGLQLKGLQVMGDTGASCSIVDGKWQCS